MHRDAYRWRSPSPAKFEWYLELIRLLHDHFPKLHLKAWTAVELNWFEFLTKSSTREILQQLRDAGLGSLPGGGAEIFQSRSTRPNLRTQGGLAELDRHPPYGTPDGHQEQLHHALWPRRKTFPSYRPPPATEGFADETGGFQTFIPLAFHPENTGLSHIPKPTALMDLRTMAISRLMLDNIPHIKAYWIMLGIGTAQTALSLRCRRSGWYRRHELIYHDAGATTPELLSVERIQELIRETGREPVERDTIYRRVERNPEDFKQWEVGEEVSANLSPVTS